MEIDIGKNFHESPFGRYRSDGKFSAQRFREEHLTPKLKEAIYNQDILFVLFDSVKEDFDYSSSFLEESFGGLIRSEGFDAKDLKEHLVFKTNDSFLISELNYYLEQAKKTT